MDDGVSLIKPSQFAGDVMDRGSLGQKGREQHP